MPLDPHTLSIYNGRMSTAQATVRLRYCEQALATAAGARRADLEAKAAEYRRHIAGHCARCGRTIAGPGPFGPECVKVAA